MSNTVERNNVITQRSKLRRAFLYQGIFTRVAKKLGLRSSGRAHVWRVAAGERKSKRVLQALLAEIDRIERHQEKAA